MLLSRSVSRIVLLVYGVLDIQCLHPRLVAVLTFFLLHGRPRLVLLIVFLGRLIPRGVLAMAALQLEVCFEPAILLEN
jgi:hypothetical protein